MSFTKSETINISGIIHYGIEMNSTVTSSFWNCSVCFRTYPGEQGRVLRTDFSFCWPQSCWTQWTYLDYQVVPQYQNSKRNLRILSLSQVDNRHAGKNSEGIKQDWNWCKASCWNDVHEKLLPHPNPFNRKTQKLKLRFA